MLSDEIRKPVVGGGQEGDYRLEIRERLSLLGERLVIPNYSGGAVRSSWFLHLSLAQRNERAVTEGDPA
jgi:hypothetical protein